MNNTKVDIKEELSKLFVEGLLLAHAEAKITIQLSDDKKLKQQTQKQSFHILYHTWYSKSMLVVKNILPDRYEDFITQYKNTKPRKDITIENYSISDYLGSVPLYKWTAEERKGILAIRLTNQIAIIQSAIDKLDFLLADIKGLLQADLFDSELESAKELKTKKHLRAAGALAGLFSKNI